MNMVCAELFLKIALYKQNLSGNVLSSKDKAVPPEQLNMGHDLIQVIDANDKINNRFRMDGGNRRTSNMLKVGSSTI